MILDDVMPHPEHALVAHTVVEANIEATWRAVREANLLADRSVRWLFAARDLPNLAWNRLRGRPTAFVPPSITVGEIAQLEGWTILGEEPEREFVFGSVGKFWQRDFGWADVPPEDFAAFDEPGFAKTTAGLSLRPYGSGRTLLSYESRTATTSDDARRRFGRYWFVLRPFIGLVMRRALTAIRRHAERTTAPIEVR